MDDMRFRRAFTRRTSERGDPARTWGEQLLRSPARVLWAMLGIAVIVEFTSDALRRMFVPDLGGIAGVAIGLLWLPLLLGVLLWKLIIEPLRREQHASVEQLRAQRQTLAAEASRLDFDARLLQALEMADDESDVHDVVERALSVAAPGRSAELLLAGGADPSLHRAAASPEAEAPGCPVAHTDDCPAVRQGRALVFDGSDDLAACPKLRDRSPEPVAATCVPVSVMGRSTGVLHTTRPPDAGDVQLEADRLGSLATRAGARIELIRALADSREEAATDPLTGLANRRSLEARFQQLSRRDATDAVLLCDLDRFKDLNDTHGHDAGDRALVRFADVLRRASRPEDMVARFGGEEFVLLLPDCDRHAAANVGERIRRLLAEALQDGTVPTFTTSVGSADTQLADGFVDVLRLADTALYEAKASGRDQVTVASHRMQADTGHVDTGHVDSGDPRPGDAHVVPSHDDLTQALIRLDHLRD